MWFLPSHIRRPHVGYEGCDNPRSTRRRLVAYDKNLVLSLPNGDVREP